MGRKKSRWVWAAAAVCAIGAVGAVGAGTGYCADTFKVGARALGMAGVGVAAPVDGSAQYYNPAGFGFFARKDMTGEKLAADTANLARKDWGFDLNGTAGFRLHEDLGDLIDKLSAIDITALDNNGIVDEASVRKLVDVSDILKRLDDPGNAIVADTYAGAGVRIKHFGIGIRSFFQASAQVTSVDTTNLGLSGAVGAGTMSTQIDTAVSGDGVVSLFTPAQQAALSAAGFSAAAIQDLDYIARQEGISAATVQNAVDVLAGVGLDSVSGATQELEKNTTTALVQGFGWAEVPVSYGVALNDNISIGANIKPMVGRVYATELVVFNKDSGDLIEEADKNYKETTTVGVDVGVLARIPHWQFGLVGRNLNAPEFDGPTVAGKTFSDVTIDPQLTAGVAFFPIETITVEVDYDVTKNETVLSGYDTQMLSAGVEWDLFHFLAVRAGVYDNQAESDIGAVYTAGLGLNLAGVRVDLAGAMSSDEGSFDGEDIPIETRVGLQVAFDF